MPDPTDPTVPDPSVPPADGPDGALTRRTVLATSLAATGALLLAEPARAATRPTSAVPGTADQDGPGVTASPNPLRLTMGGPAPSPAARLELTTDSAQPVAVTVASSTHRTTLGSFSGQASQSGSVQASVVRGHPVVLQVVPHTVGPHSVAADSITVRDAVSGLLLTSVDVWIEPTGGQWVPLDPGRNGSDLGIVAVHAALVRVGDDAEVVMYSPPREPDGNGGYLEHLPDEHVREKWVWNINRMDLLESRVLELKNLDTADPLVVHDATETPKHNIFCSGLGHLPDGTLMTAGGHMNLSRQHTENGSTMFHYSPSTRTWSMADGVRLSPTRWYPTVTPLPDGRLLIASGSYDALWTEKYWDSIDNNYVIFDSATKRLVLSADGTQLDGQPIFNAGLFERRSPERLATFPGVFVLPGEKDTDTVIAFVETNRAWLFGYETGKPLRPTPENTVYTMNTMGSRSYPEYGSTVLLPWEPGGRHIDILAIGGEADSLADHRQRKAGQGTSGTAELLRLDGRDPSQVVRSWKTIPMHNPRFLCDATLLADGTVLVSGGAQRGWSDDNSGPVYQSELFDPVRGEFRRAATANTERRYHSVALLLPDGSVLKAGSTGGFGGPRGDPKVNGTWQNKWFLSRTDAERYLPPYLWRGPRPTILNVTASTTPAGVTVRYGKPVTITARGANLTSARGKPRVALIRPGATTHGNNMGQRFLWLPSTVAPGGGGPGGVVTITATMPKNRAAAPPGDHMLVVVDGIGVPSKATFVRVA